MAVAASCSLEFVHSWRAFLFYKEPSCFNLCLLFAAELEEVGEIGRGGGGGGGGGWMEVDPMIVE